MTQHPTLGGVIRQRRLELGWTQEELAARVSDDDEYVRQSQISRIESGRIKLPRRERLERLAGVLDLPLGEMLARSGWAGAREFFDGAPVDVAASRSRVVGRDERPAVPQGVDVVVHDGSGWSRAAEHAHPNRALRDAVRMMRAESERLSRNREITADIVRSFDRRYVREIGGPWADDYSEATGR